MQDEKTKLSYQEEQVIITRLLKNLEKADEAGKRKIIQQLLERLDRTFLLALWFAIDMTPDVTNEQAQGAGGSDKK